MEKKQKPVVFQRELNLIEDEALKTFISQCLEEAPDYFFTMATSTTGKYHPEYCLGEGGLVRHTKAAVKIADDLFRNDLYEKIRPVKNEIVAALIMHDSIKKGLDGSTYSTADHPLKTAEFVRNMQKTVNYTNVEQVELICDLIASHMGQWNTGYNSKTEILPKPLTLAQKFVHLCDYLASRRFLIVDFKA